MSVVIRKGWRAEIETPGWGKTEIFAETLERLDQEVEANLTALEKANKSRAAAILAREAGRRRQLYKDARAALEE